MLMKWGTLRTLAEWVAVPFLLALLAVAACSDRSAPHENVGESQAAVEPPVLGPSEAGWRLPPAGDYNYDGLMDVLWRDKAQNRIAVYLMAGTRVLEQGPLIPGPPGNDWVVINAFSDYNGDGMADLLWYDTTTHRSLIWLMRETQPFEIGPEISGPPGDGWFSLAATDFNLDGFADVPWYNLTTHRLTVWLMRGTQPFDHGPEIEGPPGDGWFPLFGADFDRDGMADIFWYNSSKQRMAVWLMLGTEVREQGPEIPAPGAPDWILATAGDFNRDFIPDPVWFNKTTDRATIVLMQGTRLIEGSAEIAGPPGQEWVVGAASDCDGDRMLDLLWLNPSPLRMSVWLMNGTVPVVHGPDIPGPQ